MTVITVAELKRQIEEIDAKLSGYDKLKEEQDDLKAALNVITRGGYTGIQASTEVKKDHASEKLETGAIDLSGIGITSKQASGKSATQKEIEGLLPRFGDQEYTVPQVVEVMKGLGMGSDETSFKNRVSKILKELYDNGKIERPFKGAGNNPHRYKNI